MWSRTQTNRNVGFVFSKHTIALAHETGNTYRSGVILFLISQFDIENRVKLVKPNRFYDSQ